MGRVKIEDLTDEQTRNMNALVPRVNDLLDAFGEYRGVNSGIRTPEINKAAGGKEHSNHLVAAACDLEDADGRLYKWAKANENVLAAIGLWCEERQGGWLHVQCVPPKSGKRFFNP